MFTLRSALIIGLCLFLHLQITNLFGEVVVLFDEPPIGVLSIEAQTVAEIANDITRPVLLGHLLADGSLVERQGEILTLPKHSVIWLHTADELAPESPFLRPEALKTLQALSVAGHAMLLTGGAATLLEPLQLDSVKTTPMTFGNDRQQTGLIAVEPTHPVFRDVDWDRQTLWLSNVAFPAFEHFETSGRGVTLAKSAGWPLLTLSEYSLHGSKILVLPHRVGPIFDKAYKGRQRNSKQLFKNMLCYLDGTNVERVVPAPKYEAEIAALELAVKHLSETFGDKYPNGKAFLAKLNDIRRLAAQGDPQMETLFNQLRRDALLANPLLDFEQLLLIRRSEKQLGLPHNYNANSNLPKKGYDNGLAVLSDWKATPQMRTLLQPKDGRFIGDVELHFDAEKILFSMVNEQDLWRVFEMNIDGTNLHELPLIPDADVDNYDACYLADDSVVFCSTACFAGVPCVNGSAPTCNLYRLERDGNIRQLTYEQDQDWCPTLLNNGRLLYLRWEYTDIPHAYSRILFHANPDGTNQSEYYGSGSYWPGSMFYAKPIPNHPTKFVAIVGGHHETPRTGDLVLFDPAIGRRENSGVLQRIPGRGRTVEPDMLDLPISQSWPKFLHPYPLNEHFFLVSAKPAENQPWGVYLVDTFDNMVLLYEETGYAMFEPVPLRKTVRPSVIPDRIDPERQDADVFIADIYQGEGLKGVTPGTVKSLRIIGYQFAYQGMGAEPYCIGMDGPWDPRQIMGTVPVNDDGSVMFNVPAYLPFAIQPLDAEGKAIQIMRSWITAMPGETVSCVGCHEEQNTISPTSLSSKAAIGKQVETITPWYGPRRGFSFVREVQPVLDRYCVECHFAGNEKHIISLEDTPPKPLLQTDAYINVKSRFSNSYYELRRFVRTSTKEGDMQVSLPWEYHADTTRLVQILSQGHYGVELDREAWDRIITWIDMNAPFHGNWKDIIMDDNPELVKHQFERRHEMRRRYTNVDTLLDDDPRREYVPASLGGVSSAKNVITESREIITPMKPAYTKASIAADNIDVESLALAEGVNMEFVKIPAGEFVTENCDTSRDRRRHTVILEKPFQMGRTEVTNRQFALFDPTHDSRLEYGDFMHFSPGERGWSMSRPEQPVVRVSWNQAMKFCRWLSERTGRKVTLPTEEQWEYACRAGTVTPFWYGTTDTDFSPFANLSDLRNQQINTFGWPARADTLPPWRPADTRFDDRSRVSAWVGSYRPNPFGLYDMHGNVAEWTCSEDSQTGRKMVCGGSWFDPPERCRSSFRQRYHAEQPVFDVGFRVIIEE